MRHLQTDRCRNETALFQVTALEISEVYVHTYWIVLYDNE